MANLSPHPPAPATLASFNAAPAQDAERDVLACCASRAFAKAIAGRRPYQDPAALLAAIDSVFDALSWDDIAESMNGHPRIGDRAASSGMSAAEQSGAAAASRAAASGYGRPPAMAFAKAVDPQQAKASRSASAARAALKDPRVTDACGLGLAIRTSNQGRPPAW